ncbi:MAG: DNA polymerase III subunit delta [Lachnospiraceae bacterium]|nr:DNA polymerase III subunit delta [Lachnospiraceae bacterium]
MAEIREDIKSGSFKNMYLLFGEEAFMRNYYKKQLRDALVDPSDNLNYSYFEGAGTDVNAVADLINTMPFMSDHRVILCENTGWLSKAGGGESGGEATGNLKLISDALKGIGEDVVFILCEVNVDKRSALYKLISSKGTAEEYEKWDERRLTGWVTTSCRNYGKAINSATAAYLVSEVGTDMTLLSLEINKLASWCMDRPEITAKDVDEVCTHQVNNKIFDMISAISEGRQKEALKLYYDLLTLRESGFHILSLLVRQYNNLLQIRDCLDRHEGTRIITEKTKLQEWLVRRLVNVAGRLTMGEIRDALEACAKADQDIKTGNLNETMSIELLIISLANRIKVQ